MINVAICTPSYSGPSMHYVMSLMGMSATFLGTPILGQEDQEHSYSYNVVIGSMVCTAREEMLAATKKQGSTHILFIDEDMGFHPATLNRLLMRQVPVVCCNYIQKTWPAAWTARNLEGTDWVPTTKESTSLEEISFCGLGFALIERQVLLDLGDAPNFLNTWHEQAQAYTTEDLYFFNKIRSKGYPVYIDHDASKYVYHNGHHAYSWDNPPDAMPKHPYAERARKNQ